MHRVVGMRRLAVLGALATLVVAVVSADAASPGFRYGVAAGEVTSTSAVLWARAPSAGTVRFAGTVDGRGPIRDFVRDVRATVANDFTVQVRVTKLSPGTRYRYSTSFRRGAVASATGTFTTAPPRAASATVRFAVSGDADATSNSEGKPSYNSFSVYARMAAERNDFNINLGDTIYSDSEVGGAPVARTVAEKWAKYRLGLALPALRNLRASASLYSHWDDHEFINDFSRAENGAAIYTAGVKAFRHYSPVTYSPATGLYRTVRWGRHLELFFLDERSFRSAKVDDVCSGDVAPTAPQPVRNAFATLAPALRNPVPQACLDAIADPSRTMLGARQYTAFTKAIAASKATWKVVVNEVPIQQYYALPYDRWEGYAFERERLLRFLRDNVKNVVVLTTDTHANLVNEIRSRTLSPAPESYGIWEVVTGPVATNTFSKEIDDFLGQKGAGTAIGALFFKPAPPNGMGMRCAALDTYSYAQVTVTAQRFTVALKDANGRPVREATDVACAPLVLTAR
ncbi:MAG TPA: alkaline phosphatase D family protein [Gaiellaceae bacterium]|nr:alkaline phosphatase D family protein [Gaiellaceae bacterium]